MKCPHRNVIISDETVTWLQWAVENAEVVDDLGSRNSSPTGRFEVHCEDCGYQKTFRQGNRNVPQWVTRLYRTATTR